MSQYSPTINEERQIGGSKNFGSSSFAPSVTNLSGTYQAFGVVQRMGKITFWAVELNGTSTTASSVFTPPYPAQKISAAAVYGAGDVAHGGIMFDGATATAMNADGTYNLADATTTTAVRRLHGWYWTK